MPFTAAIVVVVCALTLRWARPGPGSQERVLVPMVVLVPFLALPGFRRRFQRAVVWYWPLWRHLP